MNRATKPILAAIAVLILALGVAACGDDDSSDDSGGGGAAKPANAALTKNPANESKSITVGSKNFTEQYILGEIYGQALEAAGYKVKKELNLGSEQIAYKALKSGQVDGYPEYTGTSLTSFFKVKTDEVPKDPDKAYAAAKADYAKQGITALPRTEFENTYRVVATKETQKTKLGGATKLSQLKPAQVNKLKASGYPECRQRTDCLVGLKNVYGLSPKFVSTEGKYQPLDKGQSDVAFNFSTDGELTLNKYVVIEDDKGLFPPYNISFGIKSSTLKKLGPDAAKVIEQVQKPLDVSAMQELNSRVDLDKKKPSDVASEYLKEEGFVQ